MKIVLVALIALSSNYGLCGNTEILFQSNHTNGYDTVSYEDVEQKPEFKMFRGMTSHEGFLRYIRLNLRYPVEAAPKGIQGTVRIEFIINTDGAVTGTKIVRSANPLLDAEALRVINRSPRWSPGRHQEQPVNVRYTVPISFRLLYNSER